jgi:hypothetical protein
VRADKSGKERGENGEQGGKGRSRQRGKPEEEGRGGRKVTISEVRRKGDDGGPESREVLAQRHPPDGLVSPRVLSAEGTVPHRAVERGDRWPENGHEGLAGETFLGAQ